MMYLRMCQMLRISRDLTRNLDVNNEYVGMAMEKWNEIVTYTIINN